MDKLNVVFKEEKADLPHLCFPYTPVIERYLPEQIPSIYDHGFVAFGHQFKMARSIRIDLSSFQVNSENRRLLNKALAHQPEIHFQKKTDVAYIHSDAFIQRCINFSQLRYVDAGYLTQESYLEICENPLITHIVSLHLDGAMRGTVFVCHHGDMLHYWHAFYDLDFNALHKLALGKYLMLKTIQLAQELRCSHIYLGAAYDKSDYYKIKDWCGLHWWDGCAWSSNIKLIKSLCKDEYTIYNAQSRE